MPKKTMAIVTSLVVFTIFAGVFAYAYIKSPPIKVEEHKHEEEQPKVLEETIDNIDPNTAKTVAFKIEGMKSADDASKVVTELHKQFEGAFGKVKADLENQVLTLEYDPAKVSEERTLDVIKTTGYQAQSMSDQGKHLENE